MANLIPVIFSLLHLFIPVEPTNPLVQLPELGSIRGRYGHTFNGRLIHSFEGVPYAQPPIGALRFKEPVPITPWHGTWEASTLYRCMQYNQYTPPGQDYVVGDEDCLYLNIFTPTLDPTSNLDVIVYIHGGSFMFNHGGLYRPDYLLDKDVVLVTLNYRLGPLGFLSTEDDVVPGNNGMKDQILALKFVQDYVKYFGGNPSSVTICGNSAGGVSVHFHYLSSKSSTLFHRGFSQSGTTLVPWAFMEKPLEKTKTIAIALGCTTSNTTTMVDCLRKRPPRQIVSSVNILQEWLYLPFSPFGLVVDSWSQHPLLPQHPYILLKNKSVLDVPWIASFTQSEGLYPSEEFYPDGLDKVEKEWNHLLPFILDYNHTVEATLKDSVSQKIKEHYLNGLQLTSKTFKDFVPILSDRLFVNGIHKAALLHSKAVSSAVYSYQFAYRGTNSWFDHLTEDGGHFGAAHADDVPYMLRIKAVDTTSSVQDQEMTKLFVEMLTSYAKTGVPKVPVDWPQVPKDASSDFVFLQINSDQDLRVESASDKKMRFWDSLPINENERLFVTNKDEL